MSRLVPRQTEVSVSIENLRRTGDTNMSKSIPLRPALRVELVEIVVGKVLS